MNTTPTINASAAQVELRPEQTFERFRSRQSYLGVAAAAEAGLVAEVVEAGVTVD